MPSRRHVQVTGLSFEEVVQRRRMVRAFAARPVPPELVDQLVDTARRAPSAGNTQPWAFVVLEGAETARLWDVTLPVERRDAFGWPGLLGAPVVVLPLVSAQAYLGRYAEPDKATAGLTTAEDWTVPYWWVDGGMAVHGLLLAAVDAGLGACFFGLFEHEPTVLAALGVPDGWRALGAVALGYPAADRPGLSVARPRPPLDEVRHRGRW